MRPFGVAAQSALTSLIAEATQASAEEDDKMLSEIISRKFLTKVANGVMIAFRATGLESIANAQVEPANAEMTRAGRRFALASISATGVIPVTSLPTTAAQWALYNNNQAGGRVCFIEAAGLFLSAGTPAAGGVTVLATLFQLPLIVSSSQFTGMGVLNLSGSPQATGLVCKSAITITSPAAPVWYPIAELVSANVAVFPGSNAAANRGLAGAIAIPPGWAMGICAVGPTGTSAAYVPFASWVEYEADME